MINLAKLKELLEKMRRIEAGGFPDEDQAKAYFLEKEEILDEMGKALEELTGAQTQEMERDPSVFLYGLDVSDHKRIFGSTADIVEKFGPERCFITPTAEDSMAGFGLGAAMCGMRPVHIHIRVDFMLLTMNQLADLTPGTGGIDIMAATDIQANMIDRSVIIPVKT